MPPRFSFATPTSAFAAAFAISTVASYATRAFVAAVCTRIRVATVAITLAFATPNTVVGVHSSLGVDRLEDFAASSVLLPGNRAVWHQLHPQWRQYQALRF